MTSQKTIEPSPHAERVREIATQSLSLGALPGDLVRLSRESVSAQYRRARAGEPFDYMRSGYSHPSTPYSEFVVLSCSPVHKHYIAEIVKRGTLRPTHAIHSHVGQND